MAVQRGELGRRQMNSWVIRSRYMGVASSDGSFKGQIGGYRLISQVEDVKGLEQIEATFLALRPGGVRNTSVTKWRVICSALKATQKKNWDSAPVESVLKSTQ